MTRTTQQLSLWPLATVLAVCSPFFASLTHKLIKAINHTAPLTRPHVMAGWPLCFGTKHRQRRYIANWGLCVGIICTLEHSMSTKTITYFTKARTNHAHITPLEHTQGGGLLVIHSTTSLHGVTFSDCSSEVGLYRLHASVLLWFGTFNDKHATWHL